MPGPITNLEHADIIAFFNSKIRGILNFYRFADNRNKLAIILWILRASRAINLPRKNKIRTMRKAFYKFGRKS
jgi:hypothetical protein